jgi:hypothetical protein
MSETKTETTTANPYPFITKAQIKERLLNEPDYRREAMVLLFTLQTAYEQDTSKTKDKNRQGFMSSHAVHGTRIAKLIKEGVELDPEDEVRMLSIAPRYSRQLATVARARAIAENPALQAVAQIFSAG